MERQFSPRTKDLAFVIAIHFWPNHRVERTGVKRFGLFHKALGYLVSPVAGRSPGALACRRVFQISAASSSVFWIRPARAPHEPHCTYHPKQSHE